MNTDDLEITSIISKQDYNNLVKSITSHIPAGLDYAEISKYNDLDAIQLNIGNLVIFHFDTVQIEISDRISIKNAQMIWKMAYEDYFQLRKYDFPFQYNEKGKLSIKSPWTLK